MQSIKSFSFVHFCTTNNFIVLVLHLCEECPSPELRLGIGQVLILFTTSINSACTESSKDGIRELITHCANINLLHVLFSGVKEILEIVVQLFQATFFNGCHNVFKRIFYDSRVPAHF